MITKKSRFEIAVDALEHIAMQDRRSGEEGTNPYYEESELYDYIDQRELARMLHDCCFRARLALVGVDTVTDNPPPQGEKESK